MTPSRPALALSALISGALVISLAPIFVKTSEVGPAATAFHRMFLSLPIFIIAHCALAHTAYHETADKWDVRTYALLTLAGGFFAGSLAVLHWSIELTTVANATLLGNASPIFVAIVAWIVRRHIKWNRWQPDLREDLAHQVDNIKRRVCGIAIAGSRWFSV